MNIGHIYIYTHIISPYHLDGSIDLCIYIDNHTLTNCETGMDQVLHLPSVSNILLKKVHFPIFGGEKMPMCWINGRFIMETPHFKNYSTDSQRLPFVKVVVIRFAGRSYPYFWRCIPILRSMAVPLLSVHFRESSI